MKHTIKLLLLFLVMLGSNLYAQTDQESITSGDNKIEWAYYFKKNSSDEARWFISSTVSKSDTQSVFSLMPIDNGRPGWATVGKKIATIDLEGSSVSIADIADNPSFEYYDAGWGKKTTNPKIQDDIELIRNSTVDIRWWFFRASNGYWYIINKNGAVHKFASKDGQYDWQEIDMGESVPEFYVDGGVKGVRFGDGEDTTNYTDPLTTEVTEDTLTVVEPYSNLNGLSITKVDSSVDMSKVKVYKLNEKSVLSIPKHVKKLSDIFKFDNIENKNSIIQIPVNLIDKEELIQVRLYRYNKENNFWDTTVLDTNFDDSKLSIKINLSLVNNIPFFIGVVSMKNTGAIQASNDVLQLIPLVPTPASLRTRNITNLASSYDLSSTMPPVRSQGQQGSCVSWAIGYYLKGYQEHIEHQTTYGIGNDYSGVFSPAFLYNSVNNAVDDGSSFPDNLDRVQDLGISPWVDMPYNENDFTTQPSQEAFENATCRKISLYKRLFNNSVLIDSDLKIIKYHLSQGNPLGIMMRLYNGFGNYEKINNHFFHTNNLEELSGNHGIVIVGYSDDLKSFKIINSWGEGWGEDGYLWITYDIFKQIMWGNEIYLLTDEINSCENEINLSNVTIDEIMPYSGFIETTDFKFRTILSEVLPDGYSIYLNFSGISGEWIKESDTYGHIKMSCEGQICTSNTTINIAGDRSVRAGIFEDGSLDVVGNYSESESFEVKEEQAQVNILTFTTSPTTPKKDESLTVTATTDVSVEQVRFQFGIDGWIDATTTDGGTTWVYTRTEGLQAKANCYVDINNDGAVHGNIIINVEGTPTLPSLKKLHLSSYSINVGETFIAYCDFNGQLPLGYKVKVGDSSSTIGILMKGGQQNWTREMTSSTLGTRILYYGLYNGTTFVKGLGSVSYSVNAKVEPLTQPKNVRATNGDYTNNIKITWNSVANATKYYIYRAVGTETSSYSQIGNTTDTYTFDTSVDVKNRYFYKVKAYNSSTGMSEESDWDKGYTKLNTPTNVRASDGSYDDRVRISWTGTNDTNRYYIYRATSAGGSYSYLKNTTSLYYDDTRADSGTTYYYKVTSENLDIPRATSDYSSYDSGYVKKQTIEEPTHVDATDGDYSNKVRVDWSPSDYAQRYYVYRATSSSGNYSEIGNTTSDYYYDTNVVAGKNYYYKIKAYSSSLGTSDFSGYNRGYAEEEEEQIVIPDIKKIVSTSSGNVGDTFQFVVELTSKLPDGYHIYINFNDPSAPDWLNTERATEWYDISQAGGHHKVSIKNSDTVYYENRVITSSGIDSTKRYFRVGIFKGTSRNESTRVKGYTGRKLFNVYK